LLERAEICAIFSTGDTTRHQNIPTMKKERKNNCRCSDKEILQSLRNIDFELRALRCQQSFSCMDYVLPLMLMAVLGFRLSSGPWSKEDMEDFQKRQKEKFSTASTPGAQQPE
jgi:hypothetical protein